MTIKLPTLHTLHRWIQVAVPAAALGFQLAVPAAYAGQAGVAVNDSSPFLIQDVSLSSGTDAAYLQFGLKLHNGGQGDLNMNDYGVKVSDASGHSFSARLTSKQSARVAAGQAATFRFSSQIPAKETVDQLNVVVFRWDTSKADLMDELGTLPVADAGTTAAVRQTIVQADEADSALPADAAVSFQAVRSFIVHQDEQSYLYTDVLATNTGSTGFSLPAALKYRFVGTQSDSYSASIVAGTDGLLLSGETRKVTVRAAIPSGQPAAAAGYSLQFYSETTGGVSVLGSLDAAGVTTESVLGEAEPVFSRGGTKLLTVTVTNATTSEQSDGVHMSATVIVHNEGADITALPTLSAAFQFGAGGSAVAVSADSSTHPQYLAAKESSTYHFAAVLPGGVKAEDVRLAVLADAKTAVSSASAGSSTSAAGAMTGSASTGTAASTSSTTATAGGSSAAVASASSGTASSTAASATGGGVPIAVAVLKGAADGSNVFASAKDYKLGDMLPLESGVFSSDLDFALVEFHVNPDDNDGFKSGFAKFVVTNKGKSAVALPSFTSGLIADNGAAYAGSRQSAAAQQVMPGTSYVVNYSYLLPSAMSTDRLALTVSDSRSAVSAANVAVSPPATGEDNVLQAYPFAVTINNTALQWTYASGTFTYKLSLDLKLERQTQVIVDANSSSLEFDLVDGLGRTLAAQTLPFTGTNMLIDGLQSISMGGFKDVSDPLSVRVYETFTTPDGTVKRLLKEIKNP